MRAGSLIFSSRLCGLQSRDDHTPGIKTGFVGMGRVQGWVLNGTTKREHSLNGAGSCSGDPVPFTHGFEDQASKFEGGRTRDATVTSAPTHGKAWSSPWATPQKINQRQGLT